MVKVSVVQMKSSMNKDENLTFSLKQIKEAGNKNAQIICFPEFQMAFSPHLKPPKTCTQFQNQLKVILSKNCVKVLRKIIFMLWERYMNDQL